MCHGSNNCYVRALDVSAKAAKFLEDTSLGNAIANKRRSTSSKHENSDDEFLLLNEQAQAEGSVPHHQIKHNDDTEVLSAHPSNEAETLSNNDDNADECPECIMAGANDAASVANVSASNLDQCISTQLGP